MNTPTPLRQRLALASLALLAFSLPFEVRQPWLRAGPLAVTNVEGLLIVALGLTAALVATERRWRQPGWLVYPRQWLALGALFSGLVALSAAVAPELWLNALKAALRTWGGLALALATPQVVRDGRQMGWLALALVGGGLVASAAGAVEFALGAPLPALALFRQAPTAAGPFMRLTGTLSHANQLAMYVEATLPLLVTLGLVAWRRNRLAGAAALLAALWYLEMAFLTYSRASFATILLSHLAAAGLLLWRRPRPAAGRAYPWLAMAALVPPMLAVNTFANDAFRLRLRTEGDNEWYLAQVEAPPRLTMSAGQASVVPVTVANQGSLHWTSEGQSPILLGGRWYTRPENRQLTGELRWPLAAGVAPGESLSQSVPLRPPDRPGDYWLEWDLVHENVVWFSAKNGRVTRSAVEVLADDGTAEEALSFNTGFRPPTPIPSRRVLWQAAGRLLMDHPLLGVGLDNFRLTHGRVMGWSVWNDTIHTNNWYVETVVSLGVLGGLPFLAWLGLLGRDIVGRLRRPGATVWQVAIAVGLMAFLLHGLLDYFMLFNSTALLFWLLIGSWAGLRDGT